MLPLLLNSFAAVISLGTATGIFLHDMRIDKAAMAAISTPVMAANDGGTVKLVNSLTPDLHTHAERHSLSQVVHDFRSPNPSVQPRSNEDKKHLMQKHVGRGHHAFDNYNLPLM